MAFAHEKNTNVVWSRQQHQSFKSNNNKQRRMIQGHELSAEVATNSCGSKLG
jgi:hypothetical protein